MGGALADSAKAPTSGSTGTRTKGQQVLAGVIVIAVCLGVGALGGLLTATSVSTWYPGLAKPVWNPPSSVFGPVWTTLFVLMAVAGWLVWRRGPASRRALVPFFGEPAMTNSGPRATAGLSRSMAVKRLTRWDKTVQACLPGVLFRQLECKRGAGGTHARDQQSRCGRRGDGSPSA